MLKMPACYQPGAATHHWVLFSPLLALGKARKSIVRVVVWARRMDWSLPLDCSYRNTHPVAPTPGDLCPKVSAQLRRLPRH